jgi:uncharacterized protein YpuA (DUF1002 family)
MNDIQEETTKTYTINITETTLKELLNILTMNSNKKRHIDFIQAKSNFSNVKYRIIPEKEPRTQESLGYEFDSFGHW